MLTGAIIGAGVWATLCAVGFTTMPKGAKLNVPETLLRGGVTTCVFAFWGWVMETLI